MKIVGLLKWKRGQRAFKEYKNHKMKCEHNNLERLRKRIIECQDCGKLWIRKSEEDVFECV